jgi:hypothetical protein
MLVTPASSVQIVHSFEELVDTPFRGEINAFCWPRELVGDYAEVLRCLPDLPGINHVDVETLAHLPVSSEGRHAVTQLLADQQLLSDHGLIPSLDFVRGYLREEEPGPMRTDVYSWHVDSATVEADTYLCTYHGACSEGLSNDQTIARMNLPETLAALLEFYGGADDEGFAEFLNDHCYDLHYAAKPNAKPYAFGVGNLWRIALVHPDSTVPPCIHRAPETLPGDAPRLLLIS